MLLQRLNYTVEIISLKSGSWPVSPQCFYYSGILLAAGSQATHQRLERHTLGCCHEEGFGLLSLEVTHRKRITVVERFSLDSYLLGETGSG